jgi:UDP-N-acetylglucosamine 4,6-dehydratase
MGGHREKTVLVTGGTGTFGREFIVRNIDEFDKLVVFSRDEFKQFNMKRELRTVLGDRASKVNFLVGDIRDLDRLKTAFIGVDVVINAAALKHVPVCEYNPQEAIKTNVLGSMNVCNAAVEMGVKKVVHVSTDKAVDPINVYGSTKNLAEKYFIGANSFSRATRLSCVRYGNIIGSRGSIVETVEENLRNLSDDDTFTITDPEMTRFWMTIRTASRLVSYAVENMIGGEIFVPKINSATTLGVVESIYRWNDRPFKYVVVGSRGGEKTHESLLTHYETSRTSTATGDIYVVRPENPQWSSDLVERLTSMYPRSFPMTSYSSNDAHCLLSAKDMRPIEDMIAQFTRRSK